MLADKDRIFTNIYGLEDISLKGAMSRGLWNGTKQILELGPEAICDVVNSKANKLILRLALRQFAGARQEFGCYLNSAIYAGCCRSSCCRRRCPLSPAFHNHDH